MQTKNSFLKLLSLLLAFSLLLCALASCSKTKNSGSTDTSSDITYDTSSESSGEGPESANPPINGVPLWMNGDYGVKIVRGSNTDSLTMRYCRLFRTELKSVTKAKSSPDLISDNGASGKKLPDTPSVIIGETAYSDSKTASRQLKGSQARAFVSGNNYVIVFSNEAAAIVLFQKIKEKLSKFSGRSEIILDSSFNIDVTTDYAYEDAPNVVMALDQRGERLVIYDFDKYSKGKSLDDLEEWSVSTSAAGAGLKYRENTVYGDVIIVAAAGVASMFSYPSKQCLWSTTNPGKNPHSIEILPSGNIAIASSTDHKLRLFRTNNNSYVDYELEHAHGVLWDPTYNVLWALGYTELNAYRVSGDRGNEVLTYDSELSVSFDYTGGHDLSPDYTNKDYLLFSVDYNILRFNKKTREVSKEIPNYDNMTAAAVKAFSNSSNGSFYITGTAGGTGTVWDNEWYNSWSTDTINFYRRTEDGSYEKIPLVSTKSAFYKTRIFCGDYQ